jgi:hypothetical protein
MKWTVVLFFCIRDTSIRGSTEATRRDFKVDDEPVKFEKLDWVDEKTGKLHSRRYYSPIVLDKLK